MKKILFLLAFVFVFAGIHPETALAQKKSRYTKTSNSSSAKTTRKYISRRSSKDTLLAKNSNSTTSADGAEKQKIETIIPANTTVQPTINFDPVTETEDVQSGNVVVKVTSNGNASVKIGMSPMGVTMIEFPANDPIYEIHRNDLYSDFVTVSCRQQDESGRCLDNPNDAIILRPGKNFRFSTDGSESTVITVQRVSGIVVTFIIVPVNSIAQNANHVVVTYPVNEIIQARMKAGLTVNLAPSLTTEPARTNDKNIADNSEKNPSIVNASFTSSDSTEKSNQTISENSGNGNQDDLEATTVSELQRVGTAGFAMKFGKPIHGLEIAVAPNNLRLTGRVVDTFAIRNTLSVPIKLVPEMPELYVETAAKKGESINSVRVPILYRATTLDESDILQPGELHYFSIAYDVPILGAKQTLKVAFAQTNAADEPVVLELTGIAR